MAISHFLASNLTNFTYNVARYKLYKGIIAKKDPNNHSLSLSYSLLLSLMLSLFCTQTHRHTHIHTHTHKIHTQTRLRPPEARQGPLEARLRP